MVKPYLRIFDRPGARAEQMTLVQELERRGFPGVWSPSRGDNLAFVQAVLARTERLTVGTGIANIYLRHPSVLAEGASLIEELHPGRLLLGIGVSHAPMLAGFGVRPGKPLGDTRDYVEQMRAAVGEAAFPPVVLATLRRRMTALAGEIANGAIWANAVRSHLPVSLREVPEAKRAGFVVANLVVTVVEEDRRAALERARQALRLYFELPNYQRYFEEAGYQEEVSAARAAVANGDREGLLAAISERFIADACLVGTASEVREQVEAWAEAGVTQLALSPMGDDRATIEATLGAFD